jgi:hypothetical protein
MIKDVSINVIGSIQRIFSGNDPAHSREYRAGASDTQASNTNQVSVVVLAKIARGSALWGASRFVGSGLSLKSVPGLVFFKMLGSGYEGGFGLKPSLNRQALFLSFDTEVSALRFIQASTQFQAYQRHCSELLWAILLPYSVKGSWSGFQPAIVASKVPDEMPIAALTRASIRPSKAWAFWTKAGPAHAAIDQASGCQLAAGVGEAPVFRQATISIWNNVASMDQYARGGAHLAAIKASYADNYFSESMFVRFKVSQIQGVYKGTRYG